MTESRSTATIERPVTAPLAFGESLSSWFIEPQLNPANCVPEESVGAYPTLRKYGASPLRQQKIPLLRHLPMCLARFAGAFAMTCR